MVHAEEDREFKVILCYIASSRSVLATRDPVPEAHIIRVMQAQCRLVRVNPPLSVCVCDICMYEGIMWHSE